MRLARKDIEAIKRVTREVFGDKVTISLFGSRIDDSKSGGDIDLYIKSTELISDSELYQLKIRFLVELKKLIGDQKIDLLINSGKLPGSISEAVERERMQL